jgi:hypothetical protein
MSATSLQFAYAGICGFATTRWRPTLGDRAHHHGCGDVRIGAFLGEALMEEITRAPGGLQCSAAFIDAAAIARPWKQSEVEPPFDWFVSVIGRWDRATSSRTSPRPATSPN